MTATPFAVPAHLRPDGLCAIVNHLLGFDDAPDTTSALPQAPPPASQPRPAGAGRRQFEFLIDGQLVRTSIAKCLTERHLSSESVVTIEFFEALPPPSGAADCPHSDWVRAVAIADHVGGRADDDRAAASLAPLILSGSYDGCLRLWSTAGQCVGTSESVADRAVNAVSWLPLAQQPMAGCLSASQDHAVRVWSVDTQAATVMPAGQMLGHTDGVMCLGVAAELDLGKIRVCSGGCDASIRVWTLDPAHLSASGAGQPTDAADVRSTDRGDGRSKRLRRDQPGVPAVPPSLQADAVLTGHHGVVAGTHWAELGTIVSAGWDSAIRVWDVESGTNSATLNGPHGALCSAYSRVSRLIAAGHSDGRIRLYDPRAGAGSAVVSATLAGGQRNGLIGGVAWSPANSHHLASVSHDGALRLWDVRATNALHVLPAHEQKALCVDWSAAGVLATGGADNHLRLHAIPLA